MAGEWVTMPVTQTEHPLTLKPVESRDGRILTEAVEVNAAQHCNISCKSCSHGSPAMPEGYADPVQVERDLRQLSRWMTVEHVRILGGEPLLHPDLAGLLKAVARSGIGRGRRLLTNGIALARQPDEFWAEVEEVHVSVYPSTARHLARHHDAIVEAARRSGTALVFKHFDFFRASLSRTERAPELTQLIYSTCQIANRWRCLTWTPGRLHRCPQSALLSEPAQAMADSLEITAIGSVDHLYRWMLQEKALASCSRCLGSVGQLHPHRARDAGEDSEEVDRAYLERLLKDPDSDNGCVAGGST